MALPVWPSTVPYCPVLGSVQIAQTAEAPIKTEMNAGTTRRRRKYSLRIAKLSFLLKMTSAQAVSFREFHEAILHDGVLRFTMPVYFGGSFVTRTVFFDTPPSYEHVAPNYVNVAISILVENLRTG